MSFLLYYFLFAFNKKLTFGLRLAYGEALIMEVDTYTSKLKFNALY